MRSTEGGRIVSGSAVDRAILIPRRCGVTAKNLALRGRSSTQGTARHALAKMPVGCIQAREKSHVVDVCPRSLRQEVMVMVPPHPSLSSRTTPRKRVRHAWYRVSTTLRVWSFAEPEENMRNLFTPSPRPSYSSRRIPTSSPQASTGSPSSLPPKIQSAP